MPAEDASWMSIRELLHAFESANLSIQELVQLELDLIEKEDSWLNTFLFLNPSVVKESVAADDLRRVHLRTLPLGGIPVSVKDLFFTRGMPTTAGSRAPLPVQDPPVEARAVKRLRQAGAILLGKNNLHEFAFGITNENEHFGVCRNPWRTDRMTGGSSGGSAAAVAAGMCTGSLGTDTRGSIRIPASLCGVSGLKPSLGRVSTHGVVPLSATMDHVGPIARTAADLEAIMDVIAPRHARDFQPALTEEKKLRLGVCPYYFEHIQESVEAAVRAAIEIFREEGFEVVEVDLPVLAAALYASDIISRAEAVAVHDRGLRNNPEAYGPLVKGRLETGYDVSGLELVEAYRTRKDVMKAFRQVFRRVDCLAAPAVPVTAPSLGTSEISIRSHKESIVNSFVRLNAPQNVAGIPALVVPCGFDGDGLPIGLQLIAGRNRDAFLIELGKKFQSWTDWHLAKPGRNH